MKTITTALAAVALIMGAASKAEARDHCGERFSSSVYVSGRASCGTPVYTERFFIRVDRHGHPVWGYRTMPVSYHSHRGGGYERGGYDRGGYDRGYDRRSSGYSERDCDRRSSSRDSDDRHRAFIRSIYR